MIYDSVIYLKEFLAYVLIVLALFPFGASAQDTTTFTDSSSAAGLSDIGKLGEPAVWGDYNDDGWQDLLLSNTDPDIARRFSRNQRSRPHWIKTQKTFFFKNNGGKGFEEVSSLSGLPDIKLRAATWADFNNDGFPDLALATVRASSPVILYENPGGLYFTDFSDYGLTITETALSIFSSRVSGYRIYIKITETAPSTKYRLKPVSLTRCIQMEPSGSMLITTAYLTFSLLMEILTNFI